MSSVKDAAPDRTLPPRRARSLPAPPEAAEDIVWKELEREFSRYDRGADLARIGYLVLRLVALVVGAIVTVLAAIDAGPGLTASLAAVVVVAEGAQQLFQAHTQWISYRAAAETLRREAFLYVARLAPYDDPTTRRVRLADVLRDVTSSENSAWLSTMRQAAPTAR
jgi:hypothetical protein